MAGRVSAESEQGGGATQHTLLRVQYIEKSHRFKPKPLDLLPLPVIDGLE